MDPFTSTSTSSSSINNTPPFTNAEASTSYLPPASQPPPPPAHAYTAPAMLGSSSFANPRLGPAAGGSVGGFGDRTMTPPSGASSASWGDGSGSGTPRRGFSLVGSRATASGKKPAWDYGDRFIPTRDGTDLHAAYSLLGAGDGEKSGAVGPKGRKRGASVELDGQRDEANKTFSHLLKSELFSASASSAGRPHSLPPPPHPSSASYHSSADAFPSPRSRSTTAGPSLGGTPTASFPPASPNRSARSPFPTPTTPSRKRLLTYSSPGGSHAHAVHQVQVSRGHSPIKPSPGGPPIDLGDPTHPAYSLSPITAVSQSILLSPRKPARYISKGPFKVLDAPDLADDYYLNLVDWSATNVLGVGLAGCVYMWSANTSRVTMLCDLAASANTPLEGATGGVEGGGRGARNQVTSISWTGRGNTLAVGTDKGEVQIWDAEKCKKIRTLTGHTARAGCLAWNESVLSSGSRDRTILHRDVRAPEHSFRTLAGHRQEVCGLRWNVADGQLASGGNDNKLLVWKGFDAGEPLWKFEEHSAAVKAIAWSPHQRGILASGGGTADRKIRFWNTLTGSMLNSLDTGSQVCNLLWSKTSNEIVSTHGYSNGAISNSVCIWKYPTMTQVASLSGHTYRVLYLAMSPDGQTICTGAGDETLRFWNAFHKSKEPKKPEVSALNPFVAKIR